MVFQLLVFFEAVLEKNNMRTGILRCSHRVLYRVCSSEHNNKCGILIREFFCLDLIEIRGLDDDRTAWGEPCLINVEIMRLSGRDD